MAPMTIQARDAVDANDRGRSSLSLDGLILEAWAEGYQVGSLIILILIVVCNYRRHVWLHKLILLEMILALWHGTFIFLEDPDYGWYLSATASLLFISYQIHNVVAYLKIRLFLPRSGRLFFVISLALVQPFWILEAVDNFMYFNGTSTLNAQTRPWEALARDPWWIFTTVWLLYQIKNKYQFSTMNLLQISPRFGVMIGCMVLSIVFMLVDVIFTAHSTVAFHDSGINPFWRLTLVFKCAADTIFLDDFKSVLDKIIDKRFTHIRRSSGQPGSDTPAVVRGGGSSGIRGPPTPPPKEPRKKSWFGGASLNSRRASNAAGGGFQHIEHQSPPFAPTQPLPQQLPREKRGSETSSRIPLQPMSTGTVQSPKSKGSASELPANDYY